MPDTKDLQLHLPGMLLGASLLIAVLFFLIWPPEREARTLFFPGATETTLSGERRLVPRTADRHREVYLVVEELILGPAAIEHGRLVPRDTDIRSLAIVDDAVYLDLSPEFVFGESEVRVDVSAGLDGIVDTLLYNFRWLENVHITIGGQEPFSPAFVIPEDATG